MLEVDGPRIRVQRKSCGGHVGVHEGPPESSCVLKLGGRRFGVFGLCASSGLRFSEIGFRHDSVIQSDRYFRSTGSQDVDC